MKKKVLPLCIFFSCLAAVTARAQISGVASAADVNPTSNTDVSTMITTGSGYDAWTGGPRRTVTDLEVPGAISEHGLKWQRIGSNFSYTWRYVGRPFNFLNLPDGTTENFAADGPNRGSPTTLGVRDRIVNLPHNVDGDTTVDVLLADGSDLTLDCYTEEQSDGSSFYDTMRPLYIKDKHGHITALEWDGGGIGTNNPDFMYLTKVTDVSSGRWISIKYSSDNQWNPIEVDGSDGQWVKYQYNQTLTWGTPPNQQVAKPLTDVYYSDGTSAHYTYTITNYVEHYYDQYGNYITTTNSTASILTAQDTRAEGPMQSIYYEYFSPGSFSGQIKAEHHLNSDGTMGVVVSGTDNTISRGDVSGTRTETRGDGPSREITMQKPGAGCGSDRKCQQGEPPLVISKQDYNGVTESFSYNSGGFLNAVTDRNGNTTNYSLEPVLNNTKSVIHPDGTHLDYAYNAPLTPLEPSTDADNPYYISQVTDENGKVTKYTRDPTSYLITRIDYPDSAYETFTYNSNGQVTVHQRKNGAYECYQYDTNTTYGGTSTGLLTDATVPFNSQTPPTSFPSGVPVTHYTYYPDPSNSATVIWQDRVETVTDPNGNATTYQYDAPTTCTVPNDSDPMPCHSRGLVTKITNPDGTFKTFTYDQYGNKLTDTNELDQADPGNHTTHFHYDDYMRLFCTVDPLGNATTVDYTATNGSSCYTHTTKSVRYHSTPMDVVTAQTFDNNFRCSSKTEAYGTSIAATTTYTYDANGNQLSVTDPRNYTSSATYDNRDRKKTATDPLNHVTALNYDSAGNVLSVTRPDNTVETKTYDPMNRVLTDTIPRNSTSDLMTTTFNYNHSGTLNWVLDANSHTTSFSYDADDEKTQMLFQNGDAENYGYDADHNLLWRQTTNASPTFQKFKYDSRNRKTEMWWGPNSNLSDSTDITWANGVTHNFYGYDAAGRLTTANNGFSNVTRKYDNANRLTDDIQLVSGSTSMDVGYNYNNDSLVTGVNIPSTYNLGIGYDQMGRMNTLSSPSTASAFAQYIYDAASNIKERDTLATNSKMLTPRDALNRIFQRNVVLGGNILSSENYTFDAMSRLTSTARTEDGKQDTFGYDLSGQLIAANYAQSVTTPTPTPTPTPAPTATPTPTPSGGGGGGGGGKGTCGGRPCNNNVLANQPPDAPTFDTTIDDNGYMIVTISSDDPTTTIYYTVSDTDYISPTYDDSGNPTGNTLIYTGPVAVEPGADLFFAAIAANANAPDSDETDFEADNTGDNNGGKPGQTILYSTAPQVTPRSVGYTLDKMGNRTNVNDSVNGSINYALDNINRYTTVGGQTVTTGPEHELGAYQGNNYSYVSDTYLAQITSGSNGYLLYYDALGRCVKRASTGANAGTTYYVYDGDKAILETGATSATNVYGVGIDEIVLRTVGSTNYYYYQDHEGSITHITNGSTLVEQYRYDAFGAPSFFNGSAQSIGSPSSSINNRFMFTGREYQSTFGIYEYRNRAYHPGLGRFMSEDPKGFGAGDYNLFRYCDNDPEDRTDPMGLASSQTWSLQSAAAVSDGMPGTNPDAAADERQAYVSQAVSDAGGGNVTGALGMLEMAGFQLGYASVGQTQVQNAVGQFQVNATPVSATPSRIKGFGASASDVYTTFKSDAGFPSYHIEQERRDPTTHGQWVPDSAYPGIPGFTTEHFKGGVTIHDFPGKVLPENRAVPGSAIPLPRTKAVAQFKPFEQAVRATAFGDRGGTSTPLGSHTWSGSYNPNRAPHYEGANDGWHPAEL